MDLKDFVVRFHPGIVKSYERDKNQVQPPLSAPGDLVFTQEFKKTKFPFPPKSPSSPTPSNASIDLLEVIPETQIEITSSPSSPTPSDASIDLLEVIPETQLESTSSPTPSEASSQMSSQTQLSPSQSLSQPPKMVLPSLSEEDMMQFENRIEFECLQE